MLGNVLESNRQCPTLVLRFGCYGMQMTKLDLSIQIRFNADVSKLALQMESTFGMPMT